jgi:hypothetical protein
LFEFFKYCLINQRIKSTTLLAVSSSRFLRRALLAASSRAVLPPPPQAVSAEVQHTIDVIFISIEINTNAHPPRKQGFLYKGKRWINR